MPECLECDFHGDESAFSQLTEEDYGAGILDGTIDPSGEPFEPTSLCPECGSNQVV